MDTTYTTWDDALQEDMAFLFLSFSLVFLCFRCTIRFFMYMGKRKGTYRLLRLGLLLTYSVAHVVT